MLVVADTVAADPALVALAIAVGAVGIAALLAMAVSTRPRRPEPGAASMELGDEPPAVVDLLTDGFQVTPEAVTATVLDLAARRWIAIEELVDGTVRIRLRRRDGEGELLPFEQRVLAHLRRGAVDGYLPAAALTTGPEAESDAWWKGFRREVVAEARSRGLSRRRWPRSAVAIAWVTTLATGGLLWLASPKADDEVVQPTWPLGGAVVLLGAGLLTSSRLTGSEDERDTDAGLEAAGRWLGVRRHLAEHGAFDDQSPAAVAVWDRYLAHAAALDLADRCVRELPLGAEDDRHAWSSAGGSWRPVTVRYPRLRTAWGSHPAVAVLGGLLGTGLGAALVAFPVDAVTGPSIAEVADLLDELEPAVRTWVERGLLTIAAIGLVVLARGLLQLLRGVADVVSTRTVEGVVLRRRTRGGTPQVYEQTSFGRSIWRIVASSGSRRPGFDSSGQWHSGSQPRERWYLAVDDGTGDEIDAWRVRREIHAACRQHQRVRVRVTPRLGYVKAVEVLTPPPPAAPAPGTSASVPPAPPPGSPAAALLAAAQRLAAAHHVPASTEATGAPAPPPPPPAPVG